MAQGELGFTIARNLTLADWAKRIDPDGSVAVIVEILNETNEILQDMTWKESNQPTSHRVTVRSDIPSGTWRKLNYGVQPSKSKTTQVTEAIGMLENYSEIDADLVELNGNSAEFRLSEDIAIIEGLNQDMASTVVYGDTAVYPERFMGLAPRYDTLGDPTDLGNSYLDHVIDMGGANDGALSSIWLIVWGDSTVFGLFPKGSKAGITTEDKGKATVYDSDGGRFEAYRTRYQWKVGLCVKDWRYVVRIANVDPSNDSAFDYKKLIKAINAIPNLGRGRPVFYCNRAVKTMLDIAAAEKTNAALSIEEVFGKPQTKFWGIPIKQVDAILNTEGKLS